MEVEEHTVGIEGLGPTPKLGLQEVEGLELNGQEEDIFRLIFMIFRGRPHSLARLGAPRDNF